MKTFGFSSIALLGNAIPAGFTAVFRDHDTRFEEYVEVHSHTSTIANIPGSTLLILTAGRIIFAGSAVDYTCTVNSSAATPLIDTVRGVDDANLLRAFSIAAPAATSVTVALTTPTDRAWSTSHVAIIQIEGGHTISMTSRAAAGVDASPFDLTADVLSGDRLFALVHSNTNPIPHWSFTGATLISELVSREPPADFFHGPAAVGSHTASATATPYTITATPALTGRNSGILARIRAT